jgi:thiomorpholine-carboxylate dehydrogenase
METVAIALTLFEIDGAKVLKYDQLIPAMERALSDFSAGRVIQPVRNMLTIEEGKRYLGVMPAVAAIGMGAKLVCFFPKNAGSPIPTHLGMIMLFEPELGNHWPSSMAVSSPKCEPRPSRLQRRNT